MNDKIQRTAAFKHLLWRRHIDETWLHGARPEVLAADGREVRRLSSQRHHISFQSFEDRNAAADVTRKIEASVAQGVALMGYSMFEQHEAIAILHTAEGLDPGWVAFPHRRSTSSVVPTLPLTVADAPTLRLVGGATLIWKKGGLHLECALEQRGDRFAQSKYAFNITEHVREWSVSARVGRGASTKDLKLVPRTAEPEFGRAGETRLGGLFPVDEVIWREFENDPSFQVWFTVSFDRELFCLPNDWLRFWMQVDGVNRADGTTPR